MATTRTRPGVSGRARNGNGSAAPHYAKLGREVHRYGTVLDLPIVLDKAPPSQQGRSAPPASEEALI